MWDGGPRKVVTREQWGGGGVDRSEGTRQWTFSRILFKSEKVCTDFVKWLTSAVKFGSIVVSFCAAEMGGTKFSQ